jgi:hypothetical protein
MYVEQMLDTLHDRNSFFHRFQLQIGKHADEVLLYCRVPDRLAETARRELSAAYPAGQLQELPEDALAKPAGFRQYRRFLGLKPRTGLIRTWKEYHDQDQRLLADPIAGVCNMIDDESLHICVNFHARPIPAWLFRLWRPWAAKEPEADVKLTRNLFSVWLSVRVAAPRGDRFAAIQKLRDVTATFSRFTGPSASFRRRLLPRMFFLSTDELASLWHPTTEQVQTAKLATVASRRMEPPAVIPSREKEPGLAVIGQVDFPGRQETFGLRSEDRLRHLAIIGKTGMGKSTLLRNMITADIAAGRGTMLIDPHGDLADEVADALPPERTNTTTFFDAGDRAYPIAFNPLDCPQVEQRPLVVSGMVSAFKKLYGNSWGPRLEHILRNGLLAVIEQPDASLVLLMRMLSDTACRKQIVSRTSDPLVQSFWRNEFARWNPRLQAEAVSPIQNKVGQFLSHPILRNIIGQPRNRLHLRKSMDSGQAVIVNLSKGRIGEDGATLLGSLLVTQLQLAAMSRADMPAAARIPFFAYVDEFENFATESFATILSEARKYGLSLTVANQFLDQIEEQTLSAVFGNCGSMLAFQVGATDAEILSQQFGGGLEPADLMNLPKYTAYVRLPIDGIPSRPFSMTTLPPNSDSAVRRLPVLRRTSRRSFARPAGDVEREIAAAIGAESVQ